MTYFLDTMYLSKFSQSTQYYFSSFVSDANAKINLQGLSNTAR